jgi:protein CWC15
MTTAHRPTYVPTRGGGVQGGNKLYAPTLQFSSKDLPSNLTLKKRKPGQGTRNEINRLDFKRQLIEREQGGLVSSIYGEDDSNNKFNIANFDITSDLLALEEPKKKPRLESLDVSEIKHDESNYVFLQDKDDSFSDSEEDEDADDTDEELMKEYEKIKQMRDEEKRQKEKQEAEKLKKQTQDEILMGNPLLNNSYSLKKKWFEDTVFKNQSKNEVKVKKRFINDTVRSDFHRKFLAKSIQ